MSHVRESADAAVTKMARQCHRVIIPHHLVVTQNSRDNTTCYSCVVASNEQWQVVNILLLALLLYILYFWFYKKIEESSWCGSIG